MASHSNSVTDKNRLLKRCLVEFVINKAAGPVIRAIRLGVQVRVAFATLEALSSGSRLSAKSAHTAVRIPASRLKIK